MTQFDVLVRAGTLVGADLGSVQDLGIVNGRIVAIARELEGSATRTISANGLHVFPGVIDAHVHFNEPGRGDWEGWATGSRALAAGGATACLEMPLNANPPTTTAAAFAAKRAIAETTSVVDFGLWGGLVPGNLHDLDELAASGAIGFKAFMSRSGTPEFAAADDLTLFEGMQAAARLGRIVAVHAESDVITAGLAERAIAAGQTGIRDYLAARPVIAEVEAIGRALLLAEEARCALHVVHVSSGKGVTLIAEAKSRGVDVTCETCAHYLFFTDEDVERLGAIAKCAPPIRSALERESLWDAVKSGAVSIVTSDHSPAPPSLKQADDFFQIWGGISGCQSTLPALLTAGAWERSVPLATIAAVTARNVADRFGIEQKGRIEIGADADLAFVALAAVYDLSSEDLLYRHQHSPYAGRSYRGQVVKTMLRSRVIWPEQPITEPGAAQMLRPSSTETVD